MRSSEIRFGETFKRQLMERRVKVRQDARWRGGRLGVWAARVSRVLGITFGQPLVRE